MANYNVVIKRSAEKEIASLAIEMRRRIAALADDPRPRGVQKIAGDDKYRIRQGRYRIVYTIEDDIVTVTMVRVADRSEAYR